MMFIQNFLCYLVRTKLKIDTKEKKVAEVLKHESEARSVSYTVDIWID